MTEEIDAIVFDAGGTLFDMRPSREEIFADVLCANGFDVNQNALAAAIRRANRLLDKEFADLEGGDDSSFWMKFDDLVLDEIGHRDDHSKIATELSAAFQKIVPEVGSWVDFPEAKSVLHLLRGRELKLGVVSNATDLVRRVLDNLDLTRDFDFIIVSSEVGINKPSPRIFQLAAEKARTSPNRMIYVGDKLSTDVVGASKAGMNAILVDRANVYPDADCLRIKDLNFFRNFL